MLSAHISVELSEGRPRPVPPGQLATDRIPRKLVLLVIFWRICGLRSKFGFLPVYILSNFPQYYLPNRLMAGQICHILAKLK
jgi:hypothetical protein